MAFAKSVYDVVFSYFGSEQRAKEMENQIQAVIDVAAGEDKYIAVSAISEGSTHLQRGIL